jgi:hypothetical protein
MSLRSLFFFIPFLPSFIKQKSMRPSRKVVKSTPSAAAAAAVRPVKRLTGLLAQRVALAAKTLLTNDNDDAVASDAAANMLLQGALTVSGNYRVHIMNTARAGPPVPLNVHSSDTVGQLECRVLTTLYPRGATRVRQIRLRFANTQLLSPGRTLAQSGIGSEALLELEPLPHNAPRMGPVWEDGVLIVKTLTGKSIVVDGCSSSNTVAEIKTRVSQLEGVPIDLQKLLFNHVDMHNEFSLRYYGVGLGDNDWTLHLALKF